MNIVNGGYDSANYYLLEPGAAGLLVDVGWPGTLPKLQSLLKRKRLALSEIHYLLVTHYHPDHAGLAQELKRLGVRLIVVDTQLAAIPAMAQYMKPEQHYQEITLDDNVDLKAAESRKFLAGLGLRGEIIATPGHSDDSISLILDEGLAFTGDLTRPGSATPETQLLVAESWEKIRALHATTIYPGHGPVWTTD